MFDVDYVVVSSMGNDSKALIQFAIEENLNFAVVFNDTGWAHPKWQDEVNAVEKVLSERNVPFLVTQPDRYENRHAKDIAVNYGFENIIAMFGGYPMPASEMQWCTKYLKEIPTGDILERFFDPTVLRIKVSKRDKFTSNVEARIKALTESENAFDFQVKSNAHYVLDALRKMSSDSKIEFSVEIESGGNVTIMTGRRREESQNRADLPEWQEMSHKHGYRDCWNPLYKHDEKKRNELLIRGGFKILPHSSRECWPCVCENKDGLVEMKKDRYGPSRISRIKELETSLGHTSNGKPITMFRPYRCGGAIGIEEVILWAEGNAWKSSNVPPEYRIKGVDYSGYHGKMNTKERSEFWDNIKKQCLSLGYDLKNLPSDIAYDDTTKKGIEFSRQCDGGFCGS